MHLAWVELPHPPLTYYDSLLHELRLRHHVVHELTVSRQQKHRSELWRGGNATALLGSVDIVVVAFGYFTDEVRAPPALPPFQKADGGGRIGASLCGRRPLVVLLNKEYVLLHEKLSWLRQHCVSAVLTMHHNASQFEQHTGIRVHRITFGVNELRFASAISGGDDFDLGFSGTVRGDQTADWRSRIWHHSWRRLHARGLRLFSGFTPTHQTSQRGVASLPLSDDQYVSTLQRSRLWLTTTGPSDLVGTRFFEIFATGSTLCICNRLSTAAYTTLGIVDGVHALMFSSLAEFESLVYNYSRLPELRDTARAIARNAQRLVHERFTWRHVATHLHDVMHDVLKQLQRTSKSRAVGGVGNF